MANGILLRKDLVEALYQRIVAAGGLDVYSTTTRSEAVTAALMTNWNWLKGAESTQIPYSPTPDGKVTFAYGNQTVRKRLEDLGTIVDLGAFINACIASVIGANVPIKYAREVKASEIVKICKLTPTIQGIAKNSGQPETSRESDLE
jgi:hypothetical protein